MGQAVDREIREAQARAVFGMFNRGCEDEAGRVDAMTGGLSLQVGGYGR